MENDKNTEPMPASEAASVDTPKFRELIEDVVISGWRKDVVDRLFAHINAHLTIQKAGE